MTRFVEWDSLEVRVSGDKLNELVGSMRVDPVEQMRLRFFDGRLVVEGRVRKFISVPFSVEVREMQASGTTVRVPLLNPSAFGGIPIPRFLFALAKDRMPRDLVRYEEPATLIVSMDRFLPSFVSADIQSIGIVAGGLAVRLGRGGADLPTPSGGFDERGNQQRVT